MQINVDWFKYRKNSSKLTQCEICKTDLSEENEFLKKQASSQALAWPFCKQCNILRLHLRY